MRTTERIRINTRFNGPPGVVNGGFACGTLAARIDGRVSVRLEAAIPVETDLDLIELGGGVLALELDGRRLATATPSPGEHDVPPPPALEDVLVAEQEPFASPVTGCFVCGSQRSDGLGLAPGPLPGSHIHATRWVPGAELAASDGNVLATIVWAALDCPSAFPVLDDDEAGLLGTLRGRVHRRPPAGSPLVVSAWPVGRDGRKRRSGSAIHTLDGELIADAEATWFAVDLDRFLTQGEQ